MPHYDQYTFTNTSGSAECVVVTLDSRSCGGPGVFGSAYLNSFDPNNLATNYLADLGVSGPTASFSFGVPAGATYVVVVQEIGTDLGCATYTLTVNPCAPIPPSNTPTLTPAGTATATPPACIGTTYDAFPSTGATIIPGTNDIGNHCDDCVTNLTLPFPVTVYGTPRTTANAGSNGMLNFNSTQQNIYTDNCLPVASNPPAFASTLFAYYDDLRTDVLTPTHGIYTSTIGTAPNRQFIIEWRTTYFADDTVNANFEVVLTEGSPVLTVIYGVTGTAAQGANPAAGIQLNMTQYTSFVCDTEIPAGTRVDYVPIGCGITPTATAGPATNTPTITPTSTACPLQFTDVPPDNPFYPFVRCLACRGIINGYTSGCETGNPCFRPFNNVTRGQLTKILSNSAGWMDTIPSTQQTFTDVPPSHTFWVYIERAAMHGAVQGYTTSPPCTTGTPCFLPFNNATRGQIAKIDSVAAGYNETIPSTQQTFEDVPNTNPFGIRGAHSAAWCYSWVSWQQRDYQPVHGRSRADGSPLLPMVQQRYPWTDGEDRG